MGRHIGERFANYQLKQLLGQGGFAEVYLGEHIHLKSLAAIKILTANLVNKEEIESFRNEARLIANLQHPNIVRAWDFDLKEDLPFFVMSYAPQGTLRQRHPKGSVLPIKTILEYIKQIAAALQYAHDAQLIHRDVKPGNMLIGQQNEILLSDFGITVITQSGRSLPTQNTAGTPAYMAPEQFSGKPCFASDQYALAVVVYEWLCGTCPFQGDAIQLGIQHNQVPPQPLHEKVSDISPALEQVIMKALEKQPAQRFASIQAFATAYEQAFLEQVVSISLLPRPVSRVQEKPILPDPPNNQRRTSFEQLWAEVMQAQAREDSKQAFRLLLETLRMKNLTSSQRELVQSQIRSLHQMIPWYIQRARKASTQGRWQVEIQVWEDLLALDTLQQKITKQFTLSPLGTEAAIQERLGIAQRNNQFAWMYTQAQQFINKQNISAACEQLKALWEQAPFYGDPTGLASSIGLSSPDNYEQALTKKLALEQHQKEEAERELRIKELRLERERRIEKLKLEQDEKRRAITAGVLAGTCVSCLAEILLALFLWVRETFVPGIAAEQTVIGHLLSTFVSFPALWVPGVVVGILTGPIVGYRVAILNPDYGSVGGVSGGVVGGFAGIVIWGMIGGLIAEVLGRMDSGALLGIICLVICLCVGTSLCIWSGYAIGETISEKWSI